MTDQVIKLRSKADIDVEVGVHPVGIRIGRGSTNELVLQNMQVSRQHAEIHYENGLPVLTDLGSAAGTFVNNQRVTRMVLKPGDLIAFGPEQWRVDSWAGESPDRAAQSRSGKQARRNRLPLWIALGVGFGILGILALAVILIFVLPGKKDMQPAVQPQAGSYQDIQPAVIQIIAEGTYAEPEGTSYNAGWSGSGFIIDPSGIAVTNNHVVTGAAFLKVKVGGDQTKTYNAIVLGVSECSDLAVIDIEGEGFPYLKWSSEPARIGMEVYAAGYPFGDPEFTMTRGIISKDDATSANSTNWASVDHVIMHDAQINPGNSGGPLVDGKGNVVGVNYMGNSANQFFAIGSDLALQVIDTLRTGKDLDTLGINGRADLIVYSDGSDTEIPLPGLWVSSVESGSPADRIGVRAGDIIYQMENLILVPVSDGDTVATVQQKLTMEKYCSILRSHYPTDQLAVTVIRMVDGWPVFLEGKINGDLLTEQ